MRTSEEEALFAVTQMTRILAPVLVALNLSRVRDDQRASIFAGAIVDVHHQVAHLSSNEEVFAHGDLHVGHTATGQAYLLRERYDNIELWVINDRAKRAHMDTLPVANLRLAPFVVD